MDVRNWLRISCSFGSSSWAFCCMGEAGGVRTLVACMVITSAAWFALSCVTVS
uniref:Uncharacterized protein n=1 Tax=Arundo donax TaxID=35708 RepID=A0A0A8YNX0_ARUDO